MTNVRDGWPIDVLSPTTRQVLWLSNDWETLTIPKLKELLEMIVRRRERVEYQIAHHPGGTRIRNSLEQGLANLDQAEAELNGLLTPAWIDGVGYSMPHGLDVRRCKAQDCFEVIQRHVAYERAGYCERHYLLATGNTPDQRSQT
jgi:hypothetical protein